MTWVGATQSDVTESYNNINCEAATALYLLNKLINMNL